jgi:hypothetical protein
VEQILSGACIAITLHDMSVIANVLGLPLYDLLAPREPAFAVIALEVVEQG